MTDKDRKGDVLRALGQVLGLELEHRHLEFEAGWTSWISKYWDDEMEDIPWESLKRYVFDPIEGANAIQTEEYDENSIMVWPFLSRYAKYTAREFNYELSEGDITFIERLYPISRELLIEIVTTDKGRKIDLLLTLNSKVIIDYGDGNKATFSKRDANSYYNYVKVNHFYDEENKYTVKIYGDVNAIKEFVINNYGGYRTSDVKEIYFENCKGLERLGLSDTAYVIEKVVFNQKLPQLKDMSIGFTQKLSKLDFLNCPEVEILGVGGDEALTTLDVTNLKKLKQFYLSSPLTYIDLSKNIELEVIDFQNILTLKELDLSKNIKLNEINLHYSSINTLNLSKNVELKRIFIGNCYNLANLNLSNCVELSTMFLRKLPRLTDLDLSSNNNLDGITVANTGIIKLDASNKDKARYFDFYDNKLIELDVSGNKLLGLNVSGNPIEYNEEAMTAIAHSLTYSSYSPEATLTVRNTEVISKLENILAAKYWKVRYWDGQ